MKKLIFFLIFLCSINIHAQWVVQPSGVTTSLRSVVFYNQNKGLTVGLGGKILKTTNGGLLWNVVNSGTTQDLYSVNYSFSFQDSLTVFACGANGTILRSTDGGTSWNQVTSGTSSALRSISNIHTNFLLNPVIAVGDNGVILNSDDDGLSWSGDTSSTTRQLNSLIYFSDGNSGFFSYCAGNNGTMLKTRDYIDNKYVFHIDTTFPGTSENLLGMAYWNLIYACTDSGKIFKTRIIPVTSWIQINSGVNVPLRSISAAYSSTKVWAVGNNGTIRYSADTGNTWTGQNSFTTLNLYSIFMLDSIRGWIVGDAGTISKTINGGGPIGIKPISTEIPSAYLLLQNYPNPFNPNSKIKFQIAAPGFTKLTVFDILGRETVSLVNEQLKPGSYEVEWDASNFPSGIYFYKLQTSNFSETKKMMLLK